MLTINTVESAIEAMYAKLSGRVIEMREMLEGIGGSVKATNLYMRSTCLVRVHDEKTFTMYLPKEKSVSLYEVLRCVGFVMLRAYDETTDAYVAGEYNVSVNGAMDFEMVWAMDKFASLVLIEDDALSELMTKDPAFQEVAESFPLPRSLVLSRCQMMGYFLELGVRV